MEVGTRDHLIDSSSIFSNASTVMNVSTDNATAAPAVVYSIPNFLSLDLGFMNIPLDPSYYFLMSPSDAEV